MTENDSVAIPPHVHVRAFDGEVVILDLSTGDYFGLDEVGASFWNALSAGKTPAEVATELASVYAVSSDRLLKDILKLVADFERLGLVVKRSA